MYMKYKYYKGWKSNRKMHYITNTENSEFVWDSLFWRVLASLGWLVSSNSVVLLHIPLSLFTVQLTDVELDSV